MPQPVAVATHSYYKKKGLFYGNWVKIASAAKYWMSEKERELDFMITWKEDRHTFSFLVH